MDWKIIGLVVLVLAGAWYFSPLYFYAPAYRCVVGEENQNCFEYCQSRGEDCLAGMGVASWELSNGTISGKGGLSSMTTGDVWPWPSSCSYRPMGTSPSASHTRPCCVCGDLDETACFLKLSGGDEGEYQLMVGGFDVYDATTKNTEYLEVAMSFCIGVTTTTTINGNGNGNGNGDNTMLYLGIGALILIGWYILFKR